MKKSETIWALVALAIALVCVFFFGRSTVQTVTETVVYERTDTLVVRDTIRTEIPVPSYVYVTRVDTVTIVDTVTVTVPITQQIYATDLYRATIEGYKSRLIDLEVYPKTYYITNEKETVRTVYVKDTFQPFIGTSYNTFNQISFIAGTFYKKNAIELQYISDIERRKKGWGIGYRYKF